jgi:hypothetical protein
MELLYKAESLVESWQSAMEVFVITTKARDEPLAAAKARSNHRRFSACIDSFSRPKAGEEPEEVDEAALAEESLQTWVYLFGRTHGGKSVCIRVEFEPHFYMEPPASWRGNEQQTAERLYLSIYRRAFGGIKSIQAVHSKKFYGELTV